MAQWYRAARFRPDPARRDTGGVLRRPSWQTRTRYYETLVELLTAGGGSTEGLARDALAAAAGQRRPSTLYYLVSPKSPGSLAGALYEASPRRLYERRPGERVLDLLIGETKVWSYWAHREGWRTALDDLAVTDPWLAATSLVRVLADWAVQARPLAVTAGFAPPAAAVEDLLALADAAGPVSRVGAGQGTPDDGQLAEVTALLTKVTRTALGSGGIGPGLVLGAVHQELAALITAPPPTPAEVTTEAIDLLTRLERLLPGLPAQARARMTDELAPRLRAFLAKLAGPGTAAQGDQFGPPGDGERPGRLGPEGAR
ncbi:hypothetical protein I6A84_41560 [Frankia sp. CNm7]|nr:hypothetical protein [Frankia nepalensis]